MNVFCDFHHSSLLRSLVMLFEDRFGMNLYRPMGLDWYTNGFWAINNHESTARQFLDVADSDISGVGEEYYVNNIKNISDEIYEIWDVGRESTHKAIGFNAFKDIKFDYIIASIPEHIQLFKNLISHYQPDAKLIVQIGNNWDINILQGCNVLASIKPQSATNINAVFYHQEFDTNIFKPANFEISNKITSYINCYYSNPGWGDFIALEDALTEIVSFRSLGGQCRDGFLGGARSVAESIQNNDFIFHVKYGGDGYGHSLYNAYACGKPTIIRSSYYSNCLGEELFESNNCIDLDLMSIEDAANKIKDIYSNPDLLKEMSDNAYKSFINKVSFEDDANRIKNWLENL